MRRRWVFMLLGLLAAPVLLPLGVLAWASTEGGLRTIAGLAEGAVPGLRLEGLEGPLPWRLSAHRIALADRNGMWLEVAEARVALKPAALLRGRVHVTSLEAGRVALLRAPASEAPPTPQPPGPLVPDLPRLPLAVQLDRLSLGRVELGAPLLGQRAVFGGQGQASLDSAGLAATLDLRRQDAPGMLAARLRLAPGDVLQAELRAETPELRLRLGLDGPATGAALHAEATLHETTRATLAGTASAARGGALGLDVTGELAAAALLPERLALVASPARLALAATLPPGRVLELRRLHVAVPAGEAEARGTLDLASRAMALGVSLHVADSSSLGALLPAGLAWSGVRAQAQLSGTLDAPGGRLEVLPQALRTGTPALDAALGPAPRLVASGGWPLGHVDARLQGAAASAAINGEAGEILDLGVRLSVPALDALGPGFRGAAEVAADVRGPRDDPSLSLRAESGRVALGERVLDALRLTAEVTTPLTAPHVDAQAAGRIDGLPLALEVRGAPQGQALVLEAANARLGPARLTASGALDPAAGLFDGTLRLAASDLAPLGLLLGQQGLGGQVRLEATLRPQQGVQGLDARLEAPRLLVAGAGGAVQATARGTLAGLDWAVNGRAQDITLAARGRAARTEAGTRLDLAALQVARPQLALRLLAPARATLGPDGGIALDRLALATSQGGRIEAAGRWGPERADLGVTLNALPLSLAALVLPDQPLRGTLSGDVRATGSLAQPEFRARLNGSGLGSAAPWAAGLPLAALRAEGSYRGNGGDLRAEVTAGPAGRVTLTARLDERLAAALDGTLDVAPLAAPFLAAGADRVQGRVLLALRAEGTPAAPRLSGEVRLANGQYRNLLYGVRLTDIAGTLRGDGMRLMLQEFGARTAGGGRIGLEGGLELAAGLPADLRLTARNARPVTSDLVSATLDADVQVQGPLAEGGRVAGTVQVRQAQIRIPASLPASVASLPEVRFRGPPPPGASRTRPAAQQAAKAAAPPLALDLRIAAQRVFIRGRGLDVTIAGNVAVGGTTAAPAPRGELRLQQGRLDILARQLNFQRGVVAFAQGAGLVPQLDFAATSTASSAAITVAVTGTATDPKIAFTSSPELPQDEVLARLIFDRPTSNLSPFEIGQLASAAARLAGGGNLPGGGILDRVRGGLGLDRLGVTSNPEGNGTGTAVEAGRYVAPGLYLGVRQGATGGTQTGVITQYEITPRLKLEGQTATGPAGDRVGLSYEFEY